MENITPNLFWFWVTFCIAKFWDPFETSALARLRPIIKLLNIYPLNNRRLFCFLLCICVFVVNLLRLKLKLFISITANGYAKCRFLFPSEHFLSTFFSVFSLFCCFDVQKSPMFFFFILRLPSITNLTQQILEKKRIFVNFA